MNLYGFIGAALLLIFMPGPDILFVVTQSMRRGWKAGMVFAAGLCSGLVVHTTAVAVGVSAVVMGSETAFMILKFAGAGYLFYLGVKAFLGRRANRFQLADGEVADRGSLYRRGILMNILNPKVALFFLAFLPQFVDGKEGNPMGQIVVLGVIFMLESFVVFSFVAILASWLTTGIMRSSRISVVIGVLEAFIYIGIGVLLIF